MSGDLDLCGWRLRADLPMPELLPWNGGSGEPDITFRFGAIPDRSDPPAHILPQSRAWADGSFLLVMDGIGRFRVAGGCEVVVAPARAASLHDVRVVLLGSILGVLCHQRGRYPLHASAVERGGRAVAFAGFSGNGKSTLAAALGRRGHRMVTDDVLPIDPFHVGGPRAWHSFPVRKLGLDVLETLCISEEGLQLDPIDQAGYLPINPGDFARGPLPLAGVCVISRRPAAEPVTLRRMRGGEAMAWLDTLVYRRTAGFCFTSPATFVRARAALLSSVPVYELVVHQHHLLDTIDHMAAGLETFIEALSKRE